MDAGKAFEAQVRRVARAKWNLRPGEGESQYIGLQEFEIIAPTEDAIHLVMCTISESIKKIKEDTKKLTTARANLEVNELRPVTCWIITRNAPTADQISYGRQHRVRVEHFEEFQRTLINATEYFARRKEYRFGSARDPFQNDSDRIPDDEYIEPTFREHGRGNTFSLDKIGKLIEDGRVVVLLADFGYGKSLTVRELFFWLRNRYTNHQLPGKTPVAIPINLPEHGRQASHYTEILRQHARTIGYPDENHLVRVWNGGMAAVLLDGFDELPAVQLRDESPKSRADARREATKLIWDFVDSSRSRGGVLLSGRGQYFDSIDEMKKCCALKDDDLILEIEPFSDKQLHAFLQRKNISWSPPDWLPRNPLLISYLMARGLVEPVNDSSIIANPVEGWPYLLDKIYDRESNRTQRMFDGKQIGDLLQRLASRSRVRSGGGTLNPHDIYETYRDVFDESPIGNEYAVALLQRLPALTYAAKTKENLTTLEGHRTFVDSIMADALRGLDLVRFMTNPYDPFLPDRDSGIKDRTSRLGMPLSRFGCEIAAAASVRNKLMPSQLVAASERANSYHKDPLLATDIIISGGMRDEPNTFDCGGLTISSGECDALDWDELSLINLSLIGCVIHDLYLPKTPPLGIRLEKCYIVTVRGATGPAGLPGWIVDPDIEIFDPTGNSSALMQLDASLTVRLGLTILQKVYKQRGSGRKQNAFSRGVDPVAVKYVPAVLRVLESERLLVPSEVKTETIWRGVPEKRPRVEGILSAAGRGDDPIIHMLDAIV